MDTAPRPTGEDELYLASREEIEVVWRAIKIIGNCPTAEPIIDTFIDYAPPTSAAEERQFAAIYLQGDGAKRAKIEIIKCLEAVIDNLNQETDTSKAASGLLALLTSKE